MSFRTSITNRFPTEMGVFYPKEDHKPFYTENVKWNLWFQDEKVDMMELWYFHVNCWDDPRYILVLRDDRGFALGLADCSVYEWDEQPEPEDVVDFLLPFVKPEEEIECGHFVMVR